MKIRNGFVSNSSSASFIIKVHTPLEKFLSTLREYHSPMSFFSKEVKELIDKRLKTFQEIKNSDKHYMLASWEQEEKRLKALLESVEDAPISVALEFHDISVSDVLDETTLKKDVTMFNSYLDMGNFLANILFLLRDKGIDFDFKVCRDEEDFYEN